MNQKKNKKIILILIIIMSIIILIGGGLLLYLGTDLFKSDKELFFKYALQIGDSKQGMIGDSLMQYLEKKNQEAYSNQGTLKIGVTSENYQSQYESLDNFSITFSGQSDNKNSKNSQEISINYSDSVKFPIKYKRIENTIGLQTDYVGSKFVAVETNNLDKLGIETEAVESLLQQNKEIIQTSIPEEMSEILNKYLSVIANNLNSEKFSKIEEANRNGYKLSLTGEELRNILIQLLETLKDDQTTIDKINEYLQNENSSLVITQNNIDEQIEFVNNNIGLDNKGIEITVYEKNGQLNAIVFKDSNIIIELEKEKTKEELKYHMIMKAADNEESNQVDLSINYTGLENLQKVKETYILALKTSESEAQYTLENNIDFTTTNSIEDFTDENVMILTNYESEQAANFLQAVGQRISQVNEQQMNELGLELNENPLVVGIINPLLEISIQSVAINAMEESKLSQEEIESFNQKFELYQSTNLQGVTVKGLLSTISLNNETEGNQQIKEINFNGEEYEASQQNITFIKEDVDTEKNYRVEFEKDQSTGIIYRAVINEK